MQELSQPAQALAARVLGSVGYEHRLVAYRVRRRSGAIPAHLYSFAEVVHLLSDKHPRLDLSQLQHWLRSAMGDDELADRVAEAVQMESHDRERMIRVRALLAERLDQCQQAGAVQS